MFPNMCIGIACSFPRKWRQKKARVRVPPHGRRRYQFVANPAGSRWYHSHTESMLDLHRGGYTGQFGFLMIDPANDPGRYDQEVFLALREWEHFLSTMDPDEDRPDPNDPMPEKPATPDARPNGLEVSAPLYSINDKLLGAGAPLRVRPGERTSCICSTPALRKFITLLEIGQCCGNFLPIAICSFRGRSVRLYTEFDWFVCAM